MEMGSQNLENGDDTTLGLGVTCSHQARFPAPTGRFILAQGKSASADAALGMRRSGDGRLKACFIGRRIPAMMKQTFSLRLTLFTSPRALPWASMR